MDSTNWIKELCEVSNNVYRLTLIHSSGIQLVKTGINPEEMEKEAWKDAIELEREINP